MESRVILQGLLKAPDLNGKTGIVHSGLSSAGRYTVYVEELKKQVGLKPANLVYEPISVESMSVKDLIVILKYKDEDPGNTSGIEKSDLQARVSKLVASEEELPELLALAKSKSNESTTKQTTSAHSQAAEEMGNMSPDQLRQQARMMRTMDPAALRRMNPQLANMSDSQLRMAADRMEMMANNPSMMKMAAEQMRNMDPAQREKMTGGGGSSNTNTSTAGASSATSASFPTHTIDQAEQAANMMQNMSPEQLRQQAQMLKTMDPDTLRRTNPQMANMSDAQIKMAANQFEMMASNPSMMKMAMDQMKNMSPEQLEAIKKGQMPASGAPSGDPSGAAGLQGDPSALLANMDKKQLKQMLNTMKDNPEMLKQVSAMTGVNEDQLKQGVEAFAGMDETKMDTALKVMKVAQKAKGSWDQVNAKVGGHLKNIVIMMVSLVIASFVWYFFLGGRGGSSSASPVFTDYQNNLSPTEPTIEDNLESEF